jgi:hypothetical protein
MTTLIANSSQTALCSAMARSVENAQIFPGKTSPTALTSHKNLELRKKWRNEKWIVDPNTFFCLTKPVLIIYALIYDTV